MPEDYYDNPGDSTEKPMPESGGDKPDTSKTYLINKEVCPDMQPGDEMVVKIERVLEKEYEVSYAPEKDHEEPHDEGDMEMSGGENTGSNDMASMMY